MLSGTGGSRDFPSDLFSDEESYMLLVLIGDLNELQSHSRQEICSIALLVRINNYGIGR